MNCLGWIHGVDRYPEQIHPRQTTIKGIDISSEYI